MRNYVIINGVNSLTIKGLAINELPPITKPQMRTLREEIDGRDGDIVTNLGYAAYDKEMSIGLYPGYDIDEVISFFNGKGTIIFSNEEDKYYNFEILEQIDYEKLLKFKTAIVTFHCQPFKYPVEETPIEIAYEHVEGEGTDITLDNTADAPIQLDPNPNTHQDSTTGKNFLNPFVSKSAGYSSTIRGIKFTINKDGSITINGTNDNTGYIDFYVFGGWGQTISKITTTEKSTFSVSSNITNGNINLYLLNNTTILGRLANSNSSVSILANSNITAYFIRVAQGQTISNLTIYPQLEKGETATNWEKYTGGNPAPNPDFPMDVHVVSGDNTIDICGKNLLNIDNWVKGRINNTTGNIEYASNVSSMTIGENDISFVVSQALNSGIASDFIPISTGNYVFKYSHNREITMYIDAYDNQKSIISRVGAYTQSSTPTTYTFTISDSNVKYIRVHFEVNTANIEYIVSEMQLEKGSTATDFVEHQEQSQLISLGDIEYCEIGDYKDKFFKNTIDSEDYDSTLELDKWYLKKRIGKYVFTGNEVYSKSETYSTDEYFCGYSQGTIYTPKIDDIGFINKFKVGNYVDTPSECMRISTQGHIKVLASRLSENSANGVKEWVKTQYNNGNPIEVDYVLATPENILLNDTLQEQLDNLQRLLSYDGQTNISQENNDLPFKMIVSALKKGSDTAIINNIGNIYSKPTLNIKGDGIVNVSLNNNQLFSVDVNDEVVIDSANLEAYNPNTNQLMNRQVTGNIANLKLNPGENTLKISGNLESSTITNYTRWL